MRPVRAHVSRPIAAAVLFALLVASAGGADDALPGGASYDRLLAAEAVAEGLHLLPAVRSRIETRLNRLWTDAYWSDVVRPDVRPDASDLSAAAPPMEDLVSLQQLIVPSREEAADLRRKALEGEDFGGMVKARSIGYSASRGGTTGFVRRSSGMYPPDFMETLFRMAPGEISRVAETPLGFAVVRVVAKRTAQDQRSEWEKATRERRLGLRGRAVWEARKESLVGRHAVAVDGDALSAYRDARDRGMPVAPLLDRVAATVDGVPLLLRDVVDPSGLGVAHGPDAVESLVRRRIEEFAVAREAGRIGLGERFPEIARTEVLLRESILAREYVASRTRGLEATEEELKACYEGDKARFAEPRALDLSFIETDSPERAAAVLGLLAQGVPFHEAADRWSDNRGAPGGRVGFVDEDRLAPGLAAVRGLRPGEYGKTPLRLPGVAAGEELHVIARLNGVREGRITPYDEVDRAVLASRVLARKREAAIRAIIEEVAKGR